MISIKFFFFFFNCLINVTNAGGVSDIIGTGVGVINGILSPVCQVFGCRRVLREGFDRKLISGKCKELKYDIDLVVNSHLLILLQPSASAAAIRCKPYLMHAKYNKQAHLMTKEVIELDNNPILFDKLSDQHGSLISFGSYTFNKVVHSFHDSSVDNKDHEGEDYNLVYNNCGDFLANFLKNLDHVTSQAETMAISSTLVLADPGLGSKIRAKMNSTKKEGFSDLNLVLMLVEKKMYPMRHTDNDKSNSKNIDNYDYDGARYYRDSNTRTETATYDMVFQTTASNVKDPDPDFREKDFEFTIEDLQEDLSASKLGVSIMADLVKDLFNIDIPDWLINFATGAGDFSFVDFKPSIKPLLNVDTGGYFGVKSIDKGMDAEIIYPVKVDVIYPGENQFKCGSKVRVSTSPTNGMDSRLNIEPPFYETEIGVFIKDVAFQIGIGFDISLCIGVDIPFVGCAGARKSFSVDETLQLKKFEQSFNIPIINLCEKAFKKDANIADLIGCSAVSELAPLIQIMQSSLDEYNNQQNANYQVSNFEDGKLTLKTPDLPTGASLPLPATVGTFESAQKDDLTYQSDGEKFVSMGRKKVASVEVDVVDIAAQVYGATTGISLGGGRGSIDVGDISPTISVEQLMSYEFDPSLYVTFVLATPMTYDIEDEKGSKVAHGSSDQITLKAGHSLVLDFPSDLKSPVDMISSYSVDAMLNINVSHQYYRSVKVRVLEIASDAFGLNEALHTATHNKRNVGETVIEDFMFPLRDFSQKAFYEDPISLDPEDPALELGLELVHLKNTGNGERSVVVQMDALNDGDVSLDNLDLRLVPDPSSTGAEYFVFGSCFESPNWVPSSNFDGNNNILSTNQGISVESSGFIHAEALTRPKRPTILPDGCFDISSTEYTILSNGFANTPIDTFIEAGIDECTQERRTEETKLTVNIGPQEITTITDFSLYGWQDVEISSSMSLSSGNVGASRYVEVLESCDDGAEAEVRGSLHAGKKLNVKKGANLVVDYLQIKEELKLYSSKSNSALHGSLTFHGALSENSECVKTFDPPKTLEEEIDWPSKGKKGYPGFREINLEVFENKEIAPGIYSEIIVREGVTLHLNPGDYVIEKLVIEPKVQIVARFFDENESTNIDIRQWKFYGEKSINSDSVRSKNCKKGIVKGSSKPVNARYTRKGKGKGKGRSFSLLVLDGLPSQMNVYYHGEKNLFFRESTLQGTLVAPEADVSLDDGTVLHGALYAQNIFVGTDSSFMSHDEIKGAQKSLCTDF